MKLACLMGLDIMGPALKPACCYLGAANAAAEAVQVVLSQTFILQPIAARRLFSLQWHTLLCVTGTSTLAMQTAWLWSHHAFPPLIPSITLSLLGSLSFRRTNHLNKNLDF
jgi:hypothetical protein